MRRICQDSQKSCCIFMGRMIAKNKRGDVLRIYMRRRSDITTGDCFWLCRTNCLWNLVNVSVTVFDTALCLCLLTIFLLANIAMLRFLLNWGGVFRSIRHATLWTYSFHSNHKLSLTTFLRYNVFFFLVIEGFVFFSFPVFRG